MNYLMNQLLSVCKNLSGISNMHVVSNLTYVNISTVCILVPGRSQNAQ
jgi:hypothetical protein